MFIVQLVIVQQHDLKYETMEILSKDLRTCGDQLNIPTTICVIEIKI